MVHLSSLAPVDFKFLIHCFSGNHSDYTYFLPRQLVTSRYLALFYVLSHHRGAGRVQGAVSFFKYFTLRLLYH